MFSLKCGMQTQSKYKQFYEKQVIWQWEVTYERGRVKEGS
jgi:hypothetical protein